MPRAASADRPALPLVAILALAVGIGGNTAIFSVVDATRAQAIPYEDPERLVNLIGNVDRGAIERRGASYPDFLDWRAQTTRTFEDLAAVDSQLLTLSGTHEPERIETEFVSASYFSLLRATPALGRTFRADDDQVAKPERVVVLSDGLWRRRFAADPDVIGRAVTLNAQPHTVVGVMPPGFLGVENEAQLWVPFAQWAPPETMGRRGNRGFFVLGRLRPGITLEAAQSEANIVASRLAREYPATNEARGIEVSPLVAEYFGRLRLAVRLLMAAIAFVLIIVCVNVANLLIARSEVRRREIALRMAIGAGRARLLQQLVTESCVLTALGAAGGFFLAEVTVRLLVTQSPVPLPISFLPGLDARAAVFTIAVSLVCGLAVGLAPWFQIRIADLSARLKESSRGSDGPRSQRLRNSLVVAEVALAILLVVGASLMIQSVRKLAAVDPGFDPQSLLTMHISVPSATTPRAPGTPARPVVTGRELLDRVGALSGVSAVALGNDVPLDGDSSASAYAAEGQGAFTAQTRPRTYVHRVSPGFFATMRIPFVRGRTFLEAEISATPSSVVVSERLASRFWPGQDPIGKRIKFGGSIRKIRGCRSSVWLAKSAIAASRATATATLTFISRSRTATRRSPLRSAPPCHRPRWLPRLREAIRTLNASIPFYGIAPMDERVRRQSRSRASSPGSWVCSPAWRCGCARSASMG